MLIHCPQCAYDRDIPEDRLPARAQMATCPRCGHKFRFRELPPPSIFDPTAPASRPGDPAGPDTGDQPPGSPFGPTGIWDSPGQPNPARPQGQDGPAAPSGPADAASPAGPPGTPSPDGSWGSAESAPGEDIPRIPPPFEQLENFGFFPGIWQTIRRAMLSPRLFFQAMPLGRGISKPLVFYLLLSEFQAMSEFVWNLIGMTGMSQMGDVPAGGAAGIMGLGSAFLLIVYPLVLTGLLFAATGLNHLCLGLVKANRGGFEATFRAMAYSSAPFILCAVPVLGPLVAALWSMVICFMGYKYLHRTTYGRIILASLIPFVIILLVILLAMRSSTPTV